MTNLKMRELIKDHIKDFASEKIQYEAWFIQDKIISNPNEDYCMLFDDRRIEDFVYAKDNYLTQKENDELKILIDMLNEYADIHKNWQGYLEFDSEKVYYDPKWHKIRKQAKNLYELLDTNEGLEELKIVENWSY